jgi:hypothetical protein
MRCQYLQPDAAVWSRRHSSRDLNRLDEDVFLWDGQSIFHQAFDVKLDRLANVLDALFDGLALGVAAGQDGAKHVVPTFVFLLENNRKAVRHESPRCPLL